MPEYLRDLPASYFGRFGGMTARWQIRQVSPREGDVFVLASGVRDTGVREEQLEVAVKRVIPESDAAASAERAVWRQSDRTAQLLGEHLADVAAKDEEFDGRNRAAWSLYSRLALAGVQLAGAS